MATIRRLRSGVRGGAFARMRASHSALVSGALSTFSVVEPTLLQAHHSGGAESPAMTDFSFWAAFAPEGSFRCSLCLEYKPLIEAWSDERGHRWDQCTKCAAEAQRLAQGLEPTLEDNLCSNAIALALGARYGVMPVSVRYGAARMAMELCDAWVRGA